MKILQVAILGAFVAGFSGVASGFTVMPEFRCSKAAYSTAIQLVTEEESVPEMAPDNVENMQDDDGNSDANLDDNHDQSTVQEDENNSEYDLDAEPNDDSDDADE